MAVDLLPSGYACLRMGSVRSDRAELGGAWEEEACRDHERSLPEGGSQRGELNAGCIPVDISRDAVLPDQGVGAAVILSCEDRPKPLEGGMEVAFWDAVASPPLFQKVHLPTAT